MYKLIKGLLIDIDTFVEKDLADFFEQKKDLIEEGHLEEKRLFYGLLKDNFLKSLNPTY